MVVFGTCRFSSIQLFRCSLGNAHSNIALMMCFTCSYSIWPGVSAAIAISTAFAILLHISSFPLASTRRFFLRLGYCAFDSAIYLRGCCQCTTRNNSFGVICTYTICAGLVPRGVGDFCLSWLWVVGQLSCIFLYFLGNFFMAFLFLCNISALG